jgi:glycosyltransferase involved in cell wall biosynthesis
MGLLTPVRERAREDRPAPRVTVVHDYLTQRGGAERLVLSLLRAFPQARLVTSVYEPSLTFPEFAEYDIETSFLNRLPRVRQDPRLALPLLAPAWSSLQVNDADVVLCSSSGWSHGVRTSAYKVVYCHNPARWLYQSREYAMGASKTARLALSALNKPLKYWDQRQAIKADLYLANSTVVQQRIRATYGIEAPVLHPPASVDVTGAQDAVPGLAPGFVLTVGRARGYKNTEAVCQAVATRPHLTLAVVGGLPGGSWPDNLVGLTGISDAQLRWLYANCSALVAVGREDFGLTVVEVAAFGKPVVAWRSGGYLDTVIEGVNGVFVDSPTPAAICAGLDRLLSSTPSTQTILDHAQKFSEGRFVAELRSLVAQLARPEANSTNPSARSVQV